MWPEATTFLSHKGAYSGLYAATMFIHEIINLVTISLNMYGLLPTEAATFRCGQRP